MVPTHSRAQRIHAVERAEALTRSLREHTQEDCMTPREVPFFAKHVVRQVAAGGAHCVAVTEGGGAGQGGRVFAWGLGKMGQLGLGSRLSTCAFVHRIRLCVHSWASMMCDRLQCRSHTIGWYARVLAGHGIFRRRR